MTEEEYVISARGGDKSSEEALLNKYTPLVKAIAARFFLCGGDKEDLIQEGMVGLCSAINAYSGGNANFSTYAYACIRNAIVDAVKKNNGAKRSALNNFVPLEIVGMASPDSPDDDILRRESRFEFFQKISGELSSLEFKVTVMYLDGMVVTEIALALGKPQKTVSNALSRSKTKLIKLYS